MLGNEIIVKTDALNLLGKKCLSSRMTGWLLLLQEFNTSLKHTTGESNYFANAFSRLKRLDDLDPCECNNKIPTLNIHHAFNFLNTPIENKDFPLDLNCMRHE